MKSQIRSLRRRQLNLFHSDRKSILDGAIRRLLKWHIGSRLPALALTDAVYGWGNEYWSADEDYLARVISEAAVTKGPIIECGSGLSTILLAAVARQTGSQVHSLEDNADWRDRVIGALAAYDLSGNSIVHHAPLQSHGDFDWYSVPTSLPTGISLVICDGPPGSTKGGRYGALPMLRDKFASKCNILLDDANRPPEIEIISRWEREAAAESEQLHTAKGYARVTVTS